MFGLPVFGQADALFELYQAGIRPFRNEQIDDPRRNFSTGIEHQKILTFVFVFGQGFDEPRRSVFLHAYHTGQSWQDFGYGVSN
ncbi:MAG: hypothetical protein RL411_1668 [Bacteroidota bacterium]